MENARLVPQSLYQRCNELESDIEDSYTDTIIAIPEDVFDQICFRAILATYQTVIEMLSVPNYSLKQSNCIH